MAELLPNLVQRFFDSNGNPLVAGKLYSYVAGTTTPLATYTDQGALTPNANPTILDSSGGASVFIPIGTGYKFVLEDSLSNIIRTVDNVYIVEVGSIGATEIATGGVGTTQIATGAITSTLIQNGAVGTAQLANSAVTGAKIAASTIEVSNIDPSIDLTSLTKMIEVVVSNKSDQTGGRMEVMPQFPWTLPSLQSNPASIPTSQIDCLAWSPNGRFLALALGSTPSVLIYEKIQATFTVLSNPLTLPTGAGLCLAWSPNGDFLAVGHGTTPFVTIYQRQGNTFTKINNPPTLPQGNVSAIAWSPNGEFLACGSATSTYIRIYQIGLPVPYSFTDLACSVPNAGSPLVTSASHTFTQNDVGGILQITGVGSGTGFLTGYYEILGISSGSAFLSRACGTSASTANAGPYTVASLKGISFTALSDPATLPGSSSNGMSFSHNSQFLAVSSTFGTFVTVYQIAGITFTALTLAAQPAAPAEYLEFSPNGQFLAVGLFSTPFIAIYQIAGATLTLLSNPSSLPAGTVNAVDWSLNSVYLSMAISGSPFVQFYQVSGTTFTLMSNPGSLPAGTAFAVGFSPNNQFLATGGGTTPYVNLYQTTSTLPSDALLWVRNLNDV